MAQQDSEDMKQVTFREYVQNAFVIMPHKILKCCICMDIAQYNEPSFIAHITTERHAEQLLLTPTVQDVTFLTDYQCQQIFENNIVLSLRDVERYIGTRKMKYLSFCFRCQKLIKDGWNGIKSHLEEYKDHQMVEGRPIGEEFCEVCEVDVVNLNRHKENQFHIEMEKFNDFYENTVIWNSEQEDIIIPEKFENSADYRKIRLTLLKIETQCQKIHCKTQVITNINIRWEGQPGVQHQPKAFCVIDETNEDYFKIKLNDEVVIRLTTPHRWSMRCRVMTMPPFPDEEICLLLSNGTGLKKEYTEQYSLTPVFDTTSYYRQVKAIESFHLRMKNEFVIKSILNDECKSLPFIEPNTDNIYEVGVTLNESQLTAVKMALMDKFVLIQGPPGTGKSATSASIIYNALRSFENSKIMVCAPSNMAVDSLTKKLESIGIQLVRVFSQHFNSKQSLVEHLGLMEAVFKKDPKMRGMHDKYLNGELNKCEIKDYQIALKNVKKEVLKATRVVCCTCISAGGKELEGFKYDIVLIDEAAQATEPESLVPITLHNASRVILVGDHQQLCPLILSNDARKAGFDKSLFERLIGQGIVKNIMLNTQYRMHPAIGRLSSQMFYDDKVTDGIKKGQRQLSLSFLKHPDKAIFFYNIDGNEEALGTSFFNIAECKKIMKLLSNLLDCNVRPERIGIITPYDGQRRKLLKLLSENKANLLVNSVGKNFADIEKVEVANIDAFQGREKDVIIISFVRANNDFNENIGFLKDERRLNVALTRAKYKLFLIGNKRTLSKDVNFKLIIDYVEQQDHIYAINSL